MGVKYLISILLFSSIIFQSAMTQNTTRIRHTVVFKLKHPHGSQEAKDFMTAAKKLAGIQGVEKFEYLRQISKKNKFEYGISMEFANQVLYDKYSNHPEHVAFVQTYWVKEVEDFLEIDYQLED
jgi:Stress responsive A/B Barrel Domain